MSNRDEKEVDHPFGQGQHVLVLDKEDPNIPIAVREGEDEVWMRLGDAEDLLTILPRVIREARRIRGEGTRLVPPPELARPVRRKLEV